MLLFLLLIVGLLFLLGFIATVGIGTLALVLYLYYLTPGPRDRVE